jgi:carboxypeptidase family protein/TonB-dependent receptor-like protein
MLYASSAINTQGLRSGVCEGRRITLIKKLLAALMTVSLLVAPAAAQQAASATLTGRVTDPQGDVIVGTKVTVTQIATGIQRETMTNDEGLFTLTNLLPGEYEVKLQSAGFAIKTYSAVALLVGQNVTLDTTLELGKIIADDYSPVPTERVNTNSSVVEGIISSRQIESLPLNGRNFLELALLIPGNSPAPNFDPTKTNTVLVSSAGQLGRGANVTIDGADNNDDVVGGALQNISQEAVQEFQIATNLFSAELGRSGSSVINVVTMTGTNDYHGSASFFLRDDKIQALPPTLDRASEKPPFDRQQYAAALGGPFVRDKAWWFGSYEYRNQDGAILVGERDPQARTIRRSLASAPLDDLLGLGRVDLRLPDWNHWLGFRYSIERSEDTTASTLIRAIGSASQRQTSRNHYQAFVSNWNWTTSPTSVNSFRFSINNFINRTRPVTPGPQLTFPSLQDGASFRVPQQTRQNRLQFSDTFSFTRSTHSLHLGLDAQRIDADFNLGVFQQGRIELVQDFPFFDHNGDGRIDDNDLLFAVTLRSATPARPLVIPDSDNNYYAFFIQDNWRMRPQLTLNLGLRYEIDTDVKNISGKDNLNPLILPFLSGHRNRDKNNFGPRVGFNYSTADGRLTVHGGYGIYYDRVTLEIQSLERGLDGRALALEVRAGNVFFLDPNTGQFPPVAPTISNPFTGFILPGAGAGGINIIDNRLENPMVQQFNIGIQRELARDFVARIDYLHNFGTHFIIGRAIGTVFNPTVGGPDRVINLESSVETKYDGLLVSVEKRFRNRSYFRASYTLSKAFNYANDDQIPFASGPVNPDRLDLEYGPTPNDQRHRFTLSGVLDAPAGFRLAPIWTLASGVPMDILLPDGSSRPPLLQRNAGGRLFKTGAELNEFIRQVNSSGGTGGLPLPFVRDDARFNDSFNSLDLRVTRPLRIGENVRLEPIVEVFNLFNVTNVLGVSNVNYSGFSNVLVRDSDDVRSPGFLRSSSFGRAVTTAGGIFGSGGPRAFQFAVRFSF